MEIDVREVEQEDLAVVEELIQPSYGRTLSDELSDQKLGILSLLIAWVDLKAMGYGFVRWDGARSDYVREQKPGLPEFYRLTVQESFQSMGVGTKIIQYFESLAVSRGIDAMGLGVSYSNNRAYELYRRLGYHESVAEYYDIYKHVDVNGGIHEVKEKCRYMEKELAA